MGTLEQIILGFVGTIIGNILGGFIAYQLTNADPISQGIIITTLIIMFGYVGIRFGKKMRFAS